MKQSLFDGLQGGLIVSCQAPEGSPLRDSFILGQIAKAAEDAGAVAIRTEGLETVAAIRREVSVPLIGLIKRTNSSPVYITPEVQDVVDLVGAGADIVAVDATDRLRPDGKTPTDFLRAALAAAPGAVLMADIDSVASARQAEKAGAAIVGTTLAGYTGGPIPKDPDIGLVKQVAKAVGVPLIAEGRYHTADQVTQALQAGAMAVCIGTTLTDPWTLTKRMVASLK